VLRSSRRIFRSAVSRLQAVGGARVGVCASIAIHAALLGVATVVASDAARKGGAGDGDEGEVRFVLDLRSSAARSAMQPKPDPVLMPDSKPELDEDQQAERERALYAASHELDQLKRALEKAFASRPRVALEEPALPTIADAPSSNLPAPSDASSHDSSESVLAPAPRATSASSPPTAKASTANATSVVGAGNGARGDSTERAVLLDGPPPAYPPKSLRAGEQGDVRCVLHVHADGTVDSVDVLRSSGVARLDDAAREALLRWRFRPAKMNGAAMPCEIEHTVTFRLR
jgi:protein TonB